MKFIKVWIEYIVIMMSVHVENGEFHGKSLVLINNSVCLHMGEWRVRNILNSSNHSHSYRGEWITLWEWQEVLTYGLVLMS